MSSNREKFLALVNVAVTSFPGWSVHIVQQKNDIFDNQTLLKFTCPHGEELANTVSSFILEESYVSVEVIAQAQVEQAMIACLRNHVGKDIVNFLPAGTYLNDWEVTIEKPVETYLFGDPYPNYIQTLPVFAKMRMTMNVTPEAMKAWHHYISNPGKVYLPGSTGQPVSMSPMGDESSTSQIAELEGLVPGLKKARADCPMTLDGSIAPCGAKNRKVSNIVVHLNDVHQWSRERIADWLDSLDVDLSVQMAGV